MNNKFLRILIGVGGFAWLIEFIRVVFMSYEPSVWMIAISFLATGTSLLAMALENKKGSKE